MNIEDLLEKEKNEGTKEKIATTWIDATHVHVEIDVIGTIDDVRLDIIKALKENDEEDDDIEYWYRMHYPAWSK